MNTSIVYDRDTVENVEIYEGKPGESVLPVGATVRIHKTGIAGNYPARVYIISEGIRLGVKTEWTTTALEFEHDWQAQEHGLNVSSELQALAWTKYQADKEAIDYEWVAS